MRSTRGLAATLLLLTLLACGGDDDSATGGSAAEAASGPDVCALVSDEEVEAAIGVVHEPVPVDGEDGFGCVWSAPEADALVVSVTDGVFTEPTNEWAGLTNDYGDAVARSDEGPPWVMVTALVWHGGERTPPATAVEEVLDVVADGVGG
jgi:hypothetical protein